MVNLLRKLVGHNWGEDLITLHSTTRALVKAPAEYCVSAWDRSMHTRKLDVQLNSTLRGINGCIRPTPTHHLPLLAGIPPHHLRREAATSHAALNASDSEVHSLYNKMHKSLQTQQFKSQKIFQQGSLVFHRGRQLREQTTVATLRMEKEATLRQTAASATHFHLSIWLQTFKKGMVLPEQTAYRHLML